MNKFSDSKCYHEIAFGEDFGSKAWQQQVQKTITPINPNTQYKQKISNRTFRSEVRKSRKSYNFNKKKTEKERRTTSISVSKAYVIKYTVASSETPDENAPRADQMQSISIVSY